MAFQNLPILGKVRSKLIPGGTLPPTGAKLDHTVLGLTTTAEKDAFDRRVWIRFESPTEFYLAFTDDTPTTLDWHAIGIGPGYGWIELYYTGTIWVKAVDDLYVAFGY